jgi:GntR family transcriptional regulator
VQTSHKVWLAANGPGPWPCTFCALPVPRLGGENRIRFSDHGIVHHHDGNHGNNDPGNLRAAHRGCHGTYHGSARSWPYRQVADQLRAQVTSGELGPKLPSHTDLAEQMGMGLRTLDRALKILIDEGLIFSIPGLGTFVK